MSGFGPMTCPKCGYEWMGTDGSPKLSALASHEEWEQRMIAMCPNRDNHKEGLRNNGTTKTVQGN